MAGRKGLAITERQFEVLSLLWDQGPMTVRELLGRLPRGERMPYTTVLGLLQGMERAGLVLHGAEQPAHRYRPAQTRNEATGTLLGDFVRRFFRGSAERLVLGLVDAKHLSSADLRAIEAKLDRPTNSPKAGSARRRKP
jgi:predicted transcriptional regulator